MKFPGSFSIISDEVSQQIGEVARFVRRFGLSGFELRSLNGRAFKDLTRDDLTSVATLCRGEGWKIHGCATPVFKCALDDAAAIREHEDIFKRSLEAALVLECNLVRVFSFLRRPGVPDAATLECIAAHLRRLGELAAGTGVRIGLENESSCIIGAGDELLRILPLLPVESFGAIWDPCNVLYVPEAGLPVTWPFAQLLPRIVHIHVKDAVRRAPTPMPVPVGLGKVGWGRHLREIARAGYTGLLSLETHWRVQRIDDALLHLPAGHTFSRGGEEASAVCLGNLRALCEVIA